MDKKLIARELIKVAKALIANPKTEIGRNMSYCRFENTLNDLYDCYEHLSDRDYKERNSDGSEDDDDDILSESETKARKELIELCKKIIKRAE